MKIKQLFLVAMALCVCEAATAQEFRKKTNAVVVDVAAATPTKENTKPVVIWLSPDQSSSTVTVKKLVIKVGVNSKIKLKNVNVQVNGVAVTEDRGIGATSSEASKFDMFVERELDVEEGPNEIRITAVNEQGETTSEFRTVNVKLPLAATLAARTDYALLIATNDYDEWSDLVNPLYDAEAIKKDLEELYGFKVELVRNPNKSTILSKLREYSARNYLPDDQLFIFFAGHGKFDELIKDGYIVTKDSKRNDENSESYISFSDLRTRIDNNPCRHIFLSMDACFGGTFDQALAKRGEDDDDEARFNASMQQDLIKRKLQYKSRIYLTSGGKEYVSDGRPGRHSPFATRFLEALRSGGGAMRVLTTSVINSYVEVGKQVPRYGTFGDNEPGSEFVFVRSGK
ncbi:MAG TPA: caspase family protein [Cyclobacteriaceae bacterium]|nr:caspase family protein [Cyclobacteriaceae bacterium]